MICRLIVLLLAYRTTLSEKEAMSLRLGSWDECEKCNEKMSKATKKQQHTHIYTLRMVSIA